MANRAVLEERVSKAAEVKLLEQGYVSPIDILVGIGFLQPVHVQEWRKGRIPYLEKVIGANLAKISFAMKCFRCWVRNKGLKPSETAYVHKTRGGKQVLRFSKYNDEQIEKNYRTHYLSPALSQKEEQKINEKMAKIPEQVVYCLLTETKCSQCQHNLGPGNFMYLEAEKPYCLSCANLNDLVFLGSGSAKLTRRSKKYTVKSAVVLKFSRTRKRYERQGILVEPQAFQKAEKEIENERTDLPRNVRGKKIVRD